MKKSIKFTLLFILIFLIGILILVTSINHSLNDGDNMEVISPEDEDYGARL